MHILTWNEYKEEHLPDSLKKTAETKPYGTRMFLKICGFQHFATVSYNTTRETALKAVQKIVDCIESDLVVYRVHRDNRKSSNECMVDIFIS